MPFGRALDFAIMSKRLRAEESIAQAQAISFAVGLLAPDVAAELFDKWSADSGIKADETGPQSTGELLQRLSDRDAGIGIVIEGPGA